MALPRRRDPGNATIAVSNSGTSGTSSNSNDTALIVAVIMALAAIDAICGVFYMSKNPRLHDLI